MPPRLRHALRFGATTLVAVYALGVLWELVNAYALGRVPQGWSAGRTFLVNETEWRWIAGGVALAVTLLRLSDIHKAPPSWLFAWVSGLWVAVSTIVVLHLVSIERWGFAGTIALGAIVSWVCVHQRIPGDPTRGGDLAAQGELR
jgi:hypothetical protein